MNKDFAIDVKNLSKSFANVVAVDHINLQVTKGEIFGFLGPNGSGKTTTLRMLCGLLNPDAGEGHCLGYDILKDSLTIKTQVGYMTQRFSYYEDMTVLENLQFVARVFQVDHAAKKIAQIIEEFNFKFYQKQLAGNLSGGWKQRLALAASLLHAPKLLLLDEPTAGVDPEARREFWDKINELSEQGITTLVSTHYMDEAERCHRLAYIAYGHLLRYGTPNEILQQVGLVTYKIDTENLAEFQQQLTQRNEKLQFVRFGKSLHVSSHNAEVLASLMQPYLQNPAYKIEKVTTNLEDVFIYLIETARHEKSMAQ